MHQFRNDYSEGAAPEVLDALLRTNGEQTPGYGTDEHCAHAAELIRETCGQANLGNERPLWRAHSFRSRARVPRARRRRLPRHTPGHAVLFQHL